MGVLTAQRIRRPLRTGDGPSFGQKEGGKQKCGEGAEGARTAAFQRTEAVI